MKSVVICAVPAAALARAGEIAERMPDLRRQRYEAARDAGVRGELLAAAAALDGALAAALPGYAPPADFFYYPDGRPGVKGVCVSIAHTRGMAVCAASECPVGVDIECAGRIMRPEMARKVLAPGERPECGRGLLDVWVDKEAYLKLTGQGLAWGMWRVRTDGNAIFDAEGRRAARIKRMNIDGFIISVCCREEFLLALAPGE